MNNPLSTFACIHGVPIYLYGIFLPAFYSIYIVSVGKKAKAFPFDQGCQETNTKSRFISEHKILNKSEFYKNP